MLSKGPPAVEPADSQQVAVSKDAIMVISRWEGDDLPYVALRARSRIVQVFIAG